VGRSLAIAVFAAAAFSLLAAGCGGSTSYSLEKTRACLKGEKDVRLGPVPHSDFIASVAEGGAVAVSFPSRNRVTIAFGMDQEEADRIAAGYRRFRGKNIGIEDVLRPNHNAVLLWKEHPTSDDESTVTDCLK
jgi:hypothetical protein